MMVFLLNAERRPDSSLEACRTLKSVSLLRREAQTRFKPGLLGPGDVKLKRVTLKVRKMIEKLATAVSGNAKRAALRQVRGRAGTKSVLGQSPLPKTSSHQSLLTIHLRFRLLRQLTHFAPHCEA